MKIKAFRKTKEGEYELNRLVFDVKPWWFVPRNVVNPTHPEQILMGASSVSNQVQFQTLEEGAFEGFYLTCQRADVCLVELFDDHAKRGITGRPCHVDTIMGDGQRPFILPESVFLLRRQSLLFKATDISGGGNNIRPIITGQRVNPERVNSKELREWIEDRRARRLFMMPFMCPLDQDVSLTAGQERDYYYTQEDLSNFEIKKLTYVSTGAFKFKIKDETGTVLTENWLYSTAILGTAQFPFLLPTPWFVKAGGMLTFTIKDLSAAPNDVYLTLSGRATFV